MSMTAIQIEAVERIYRHGNLFNVVDSRYIQRELDRIFGDSQVVVHKHFWPMWSSDGYGNINGFDRIEVMK